MVSSLGGCTHMHLTCRGFIIADVYHIIRRFVTKANGTLGKFLLNCSHSQQIGTSEVASTFFQLRRIFIRRDVEKDSTAKSGIR
jgi:hypothetical protein